MNLLKTGLVASFVLFSAQASMADCLASAQITATVSTAAKTGVGCILSVTAYSIQQFNSNKECPLHLNEIIENGFEFVSPYGHGCPFEVGSELSGTLSKDSSGNIYLQ